MLQHVKLLELADIVLGFGNSIVPLIQSQIIGTRLLFDYNLFEINVRGVGD